MHYRSRHVAVVSHTALVLFPSLPFFWCRCAQSVPNLRFSSNRYPFVAVRTLTPKLHTFDSVTKPKVPEKKIPSSHACAGESTPPRSASFCCDVDFFLFLPLQHFCIFAVSDRRMFYTDTTCARAKIVVHSDSIHAKALNTRVMQRMRALVFVRISTFRVTFATTTARIMMR